MRRRAFASRGTDTKQHIKHSAGPRVGLRRKLAGLLAAFALFAVLTATATIYGIRWHVETALRGFEQTLGRTVHADRLYVALREQVLALREVVEGHPEAVEPYFASREEFSSRLRRAADFSPTKPVDGCWKRILELSDRLAKVSDRCIALSRDSKIAEARDLLASHIKDGLLPDLEAELLNARAELDTARSDAVRRLGASSSQVLTLTIVVGVLAAGLVIAGVMLIRRWLIVPIVELQGATRRFAGGELSFRVSPRSDDELGELGIALNEMAQSLATLRAELQASETKHRLLFQNLRDAVVICDAGGRIVEYHDSDARLLGVEGREHIGRSFLNVFPVWKSSAVDWPAIIEAAVTEGRRYRAVDVALTGDDPAGDAVSVDIVVYRIEYGNVRYAVIVMRDVTDRQRLQRKVRQAETMEAVGTLAGGLAHDFNNLLAGVIGSLSLVATEVRDSRQAERLRNAIKTCWQAAGLSRRLLNFAGSAHGHAQVFCAREAACVILDSLDPSFLEGVAIERDLPRSVWVRMDQDQYTQILLNLIRNARDAMPDGGTLRIGIQRALARDPEGGSVERPYAVVLVQDSGVGMTREVQGRLFEPFFTTKSRATRRGRGMGMAMVHSAVRNAGGFMQFESEPGCGTTFRVYLPVDDEARTTTTHDDSAVSSRPGRGTVLLVEEDAVIRDFAAEALGRWGYSVLAADGLRDARAKLEEKVASQAHPMGASGGIAVALIDMHLSEGDSMELAEHVLSCSPHAAVVFTTAGATRSIPSHLQQHVRSQLEKPFRLEDLAAAVSGVSSASTPHPSEQSKEP